MLSTCRNDDPSTLLEKYQTLAPLEQEICQAGAIAFNNHFRCTEALEFLQEIGISPGHEKKLNYATMSSIFNELRKRDIITDNLSVRRSLIHMLTIEALNGPHRSAFLRYYGLEDPNKTPSTCTHQSQMCGLRLQMYLSPHGTEQTAKGIVEHPLFHEMISQSFSYAPVDLEWLTTLPFCVQSAIAERLMSLLWSLNKEIVPNLSSVLSYFRSCLERPDAQNLRTAFLFHAVLTADIRCVTEEMINSIDQTKPLDIALYASYVFLKGDNEQSLATFEKALGLVKPPKSSKKYFHHNLEGIFHILALLRSKDPKAPKMAYEIAAFAVKNSREYFKPAFRWLLTCVKFIMTRTRSPDLGDEDLFGDSNPAIVQAISSLCLLWIDRNLLFDKTSKLRNKFDSLKEILPGIARMFAEVGLVVSPDNQVYQAYLNQTKDLNAISFSQIVPIKEFWEESLTTLETLFANKDGEIDASTESQGDRRLMWEVNLEYSVIAGAVEQKRRGNGEWSKGRPIAFSRLKDGEKDFDYATEQDRRLMQCVTSQQYYTYGYYTKEEFSVDPKKAFPLLIGHPNIRDVATELPLEFVKGSVELIVKEQGDAYTVSLNVPCAAQVTLLKLETQTRYQVIEVSKEAVQLQQIIGFSNALAIPKTEKKRLQKIVNSIGKRFPVQSELCDETVRKKADASLCIQLSSMDNVLKINLCVRPFGAEGPLFRPGHGFQTPQATIKGKIKKVLRSLSEERQLADQLISSIKLLQLYDEGKDEWILDDSKEILEAISDLQAYPQPLTILWPSGKKISVTSPLDAKALSLRIERDIDWFSLDGEVKISEDKVLELKQLLELLDSTNRSFVRLGDGQYLALTERFEHQLRELKVIAEQESGKIRLHPLSSHALNDILDAVGDVKADDVGARRSSGSKTPRPTHQ